MLDTIQLLRPYHVPGIFRQRLPFVGYDGGYVAPVRQCLASEVFYCLGIGDHAPFEEALCRQLPHKEFRLFDMQEPPHRWWEGLPNVQFFVKRFGGDGDRLADCIAELGDTGRPLTLKVDIEGAEWDLLESLDDRLLDSIDVLIGEFHELERDREQQRYQAVFRRLNAHFTLIHVHGNNFGGQYSVGGEPSFHFPRTVELTYLHHRHVPQRIPSTERFPTAIDFPNNPEAADYEIRFPPEPARPAVQDHRAVVTIDLALPSGTLRSYSEELSGGQVLRQMALGR